MSKFTTSKIIITTLLLLCANALFIWGISKVYNYLNSGADRKSMLHTERIVKNKHSHIIAAFSTNDKDKEKDKETIKNIKKGYLGAWFSRDLAYRTNLKDGIDDYFTTNAQTNIYDCIALNESQKIHLETTSLYHQIQVDFLNIKKDLAVLTDTNVLEYKRILKDEKWVFESYETNTYRSILLLEENQWKIHQLIKEQTKEELALQSVALAFDTIKGINYYPKNAPWDTFGKRFEITPIIKDFRLLKRNGLNTVRIFVQYEDFGKETVRKDKLERLAQLLDAANNENISVIVTLFDFYGNYAVSDWTYTKQHIQTLAETFKNHPAILAWDLKNEPDLDFESRGKEEVLSWLNFSLKTLKSIDTLHPVTIGWAQPKSAVLLNQKLDFVSFHYYKSIDNLQKEFLELKRKIPNKPIVLGEFGVSSYGGIWNLFQSSEETQARFHKQIQNIIFDNNIPYLSWTLYDFKKVPKEVVGWRPWRRNPQKKYGFIDVRGKPKKSFQYLNSPLK